MAEEKKKKTATKYREPKWTWEQLRWYHNLDGFERDHWWLNSSSGKVNENHPELFARKRKNQSKQFRPAPIYWELLRRHPDVPGLNQGLRDLLDNLAEEEPGFESAPFDRDSLSPASNFFRWIPAALAEIALLYKKTWVELPTVGQKNFAATFHLLYNEAPFTTNRLTIRGPHTCHNLLGGEGCPDEIDFSKWKSTSWREHLLTKNGEEKRPPWVPKNFPNTAAGIALVELQDAARALGLDVALVAIDRSKGKEELLQGLAKCLGLKEGRNPQKRNRVSVTRLDSIAGLDAVNDGASKGDALKQARKLFYGLRLFGPAAQKFYLDFDFEADRENLMEYFKEVRPAPNFSISDDTTFGGEKLP